MQRLWLPILCPVISRIKIYWHNFLFLDFVRLNFLKNMMFRKPALLPSSGKEAPNLVDSLDQAILSNWIPQKYFTC